MKKFGYALVTALGLSAALFGAAGQAVAAPLDAGAVRHGDHDGYYDNPFYDLVPNVYVPHVDTSVHTHP